MRGCISIALLALLLGGGCDSGASVAADSRVVNDVGDSALAGELGSPLVTCKVPDPVPPSDPGTGPACRGDADCDSGRFCYSGGPYCGVACGSEACWGNSDCGAGKVCVNEGCCGSCVPTAEQCDQGYSCPEENWDCAPTSPSADTHGCVRRSCTVDSDCDCGACVNTECHSELGRCVLPAA